MLPLLLGDAFHFVYQQDGDKEFYSFFHPSFHPLHPMASNPAHVQGMISPQEGRGGARWSCNRAGGGFSYSTDAAGSWSKMALGGPLNQIETSYQWKKMKHNKWNFKGCPPSGQKPEVLMCYFLSLSFDGQWKRIFTRLNILPNQIYAAPAIFVAPKSARCRGREGGGVACI